MKHSILGGDKLVNVVLVLETSDILCTTHLTPRTGGG